MKRPFLYVCFVTNAVFLFTKCKKDDSSTTTADYSPLTIGSTWTYNYKQNASTPTVFTVTATANDTTVGNGKKYKILTSTQGINTYMLKSGHDYYRFVSYPTVGISNHEEHYLKDNVAVNSTWSDTANFAYPGATFSLTANLVYKIVGTGVDTTVNGTNYNDVIHVRLTASVPLLAPDIGGGDFYYAKNIGMIYSSISLASAGQPSFSSTQQLASHEIK